jgi:hypothetical protein
MRIKGPLPLILLTGSALLVVIELGCIGHQYHRATILIRNHSGHNLEDVGVEMREGVQNLGMLFNNATRRVQVFPRGESSFLISFITPDQNRMSAPGAHIESTGGYRVASTINPDWTVSNKYGRAYGCVLFPLYEYWRNSSRMQASGLAS